MEEYKETSKAIYNGDKYTKGKEIYVTALIFIDPICSFSDGEYNVCISTGKNFIDILDTELVEECISNDLEDCIGEIPNDENIEIEMIDDGEWEDVFYNRYFRIKKVSIVTLEEI